MGGGGEEGSSGSFKVREHGQISSSVIPYSLLSLCERSRSGAWTVESGNYIARHVKCCFCRWSRGRGGARGGGVGGDIYDLRFVFFPATSVRGSETETDLQDVPAGELRCIEFS